MRLVTFALGIVVGAVFSSIIVLAWTGPTATAPGNNVSAPFNRLQPPVAASKIREPFPFQSPCARFPKSVRSFFNFRELRRCEAVVIFDELRPV
jgi:hypothetical protein